MIQLSLEGCLEIIACNQMIVRDFLEEIAKIEDEELRKLNYLCNGF